MARLESSIENSANNGATKLGIKNRKMNGEGQRSWPDRFYYSKFFRVGVKAVFIEYKAEGKVPTELQYEKMQELRDAGFDVAWTDNPKAAVAYLKGFINAKNKSTKKFNGGKRVRDSYEAHQREDGYLW